MKTVASLRVSTGSQDLATQKLAILDFTQKRRFTVDAFIESRISSRKSPIERRIEEMLGTLQSGDRLLVSELSRLGRSLSQVLQIVATLIERKIRFIAIKEAIEVEGKQDLRTKVMIAMFGLFAEVERDLISEPRRIFMAKKSIFISYDYDYDKHWKSLLVAWDKNGEFDLTFYDASVDVSVNSTDAAAIKRVISARIRGATRFLCIVGKYTHKSGWVKWEIEKAVELNSLGISIAKRSEL